MSFDYLRCVLVFLCAASLRAMDPLEAVVAELFDTRTEIAATQKEYDALLHEHHALSNRIVSVQRDFASAQEQNQKALQTLADMETLVSNLWTRIPASCRTNAPSQTSFPPTPETRISTLRRDMQILSKLHAKFLHGFDIIPVEGASSPHDRRLCEILALGLSCAIAVSDDDTFAAIGAPADDETWRWTSAPSRAQEFRAVLRAYHRRAPALFPVGEQTGNRR